jgi:copper resistance protein C
MKRLLIAAGVLVAVVLPAAPARAHNQLMEAAPAEGATVTAAPREVSLRFLQKLNPEFTTIVISDAAQQRVPTAAEPLVTGATGVVTLGGALANGRYTVAYRVVSVDGHAVKGSYRFTVADPNRPTATTPVPVPTSEAAPPPPAAAPSTSSGGLSGPLWIGSATGVVLIGIGVAFRPRGRRNPRPPAIDK